MSKKPTPNPVFLPSSYIDFKEIFKNFKEFLVEKSEKFKESGFNENQISQFNQAFAQICQQKIEKIKAKIAKSNDNQGNLELKLKLALYKQFKQEGPDLEEIKENYMSYFAHLI